MLENFPTDLISLLKSGFPVLIRLSDDQIRLATQMAIKHADSHQPPHRREPDVLSKLGGMTVNEAGPFFITLVTLLRRLPSSESGVEDASNELIAQGILGTTEQVELVRVLNTLSAFREEAARTFSKVSVANALLPSFSGMETVVDLRPVFRAGDILLTVPVTVAMLRTDIDGKYLYFQATKGQLKDCIEQLSETLERMEILEAWASRSNENL